VDKYNGAENPDTWLPDYINAVGINDGGYNDAVRFLPLMLEGTARLWIDTLPEKSIHNWQDMQKTFTQHFSCTYKRPKTYIDLQKCTQAKGESSRSFIARWTETKNACEGVSENQAIHAFMQSLKRGNMMRYMLQSQNLQRLGDLLDSANNFAAAEDDARAEDGNIRMDIDIEKKSGNRRKGHGGEQAGPSAEVAFASGKGGQGNKWKSKKGDDGQGPKPPKITYDDIKDQPCAHHIKLGKCTHTNRQCRLVNDFKRDPEAGYKPKNFKRKGRKERREDKDNDDSSSGTEQPEQEQKKGAKFPRVQESMVTFLATRSAKKEKAVWRELNATMPAVPQYLNWSEIPITWDRTDHPERVPQNPGNYALVVNPIVEKCRLSKVLMDGGSSINILYLETLKRMHLSETQLIKSDVKFHGIVPGRQANSMGMIVLKVTFGDETNFRTEDVAFEVVPFKSSYHAIFGRPAFARFMARPCYIYSKLKIPGPNGVITVHGNYKKAKECEAGNAILAEAVISAEELEQYKKEVDLSEMPAGKQPLPASAATFKAGEHSKKARLDDTDASKTTNVGTSLDSA